MTIREIAQLCDLPPTTVHRALKTPDKVKPHILQQVTSVLHAPYKPNSKLKKVFVVLPYLNNFHNLFIIHVTRLLSQKNILVTPFITDEDPEKEQDFLKNLTLSSRIGLMWCPSSNNVADSFLKKKTRPIPWVLLYRHISNTDSDVFISQDNFKGIDIAMKEFIEQGCKNILLLNGHSLTQTTASDRKQRFQDILQANPDISGDIIEANFNDWSDAYTSIKNNPTPLTNYDAVISTNELLTYGLIRVVKDLNLTISKDIKITSFDYTVAFDILSIRCIHFSAEKMAAQAVKLILEKSTDPNYKNHYTLSPISE